MYSQPVRRKVAFVMPLFGDGGGERTWANLLGALDREQFEPILVFFAKIESHFLDEIPPDVRVYDLAMKRRFLVELPRLVWRLRRLLRAERPAVALSMLHTWGFALDLARILARIDMPIVANEHINVGRSLAYLRTHRRWLSRIAPLLHRIVYRRAAAVVVVSNDLAEDIVAGYHVPRRKIEVIPNGIDPGRIRRLAAAEAEDTAADDSCPLVVAIGRLVAQKAFDDLIGAFAVVRARTKARLVIFGDGPERSRLERLVTDLGLADAVFLEGRTPNPYWLLARADVFALSSTWEGQGQVILEALALGTPVVSTDCPSGPRELLDGGRYGILVPPGDPPALAEAILGLLGDPARRAELSERGPARADAFRIDEMARRYEAALAAAIR